MHTILSLLASGEEVSGEAISQQLGISRAAVWKRIEQLRAEGWTIDSAPHRGYRLRAFDRIEPVLWTQSLTTQTLGRGESHFAHTLTSTNTVLKQMAVHGAPHGSLCLCEHQTAGKGRLGRTWNTSEGQGLYVSVLLRPALRPQNAPLITFAAALSMARAVQEVCPADVRIKWPNDLVLCGKKLCGILLEISADLDQIEYVVVGTGLNVHPGAYPKELADKAISLSEVVDAPLRRDLLTHYLQALEDNMRALEQDGFSGISDAYRRQCCTIGSRVHVLGVTEEFTGTAEDVDAAGALLVRTDDGQLRTVYSGDVSVRGVMGYV